MSGESSPQVRKSTSEEADLTDVLAMLYRDLEKQLARADAKAALILTANSILLAVSANVVVMYARGVDSAINLLWPLLSLVPALLLSGVALNCALSVAYPRADQALRDAPPPPGMGGWFNPASIARLPQAEYVRQFLEADMLRIKSEALGSVHAKSRILGVKFGLVRRGIQATVGAFFAWLAFVVVTLTQMHL